MSENEVGHDVFAVSRASGALGGRVATRLASLGHGQRLIVRNIDRAPDLPGAKAAQASCEEPEAMRRALDGVGTFFMVSAGEAADRVRQHGAAVDAAVAAVVERILHLSFINAAPEATFTFARGHSHTEEHVRGRPAPHVSWDNMYLDFLPTLAGTDGVIRGPAGNGRLGAVARDDIADVDVAVLLGDAHDGQTYGATGSEAITLQQAAQELSRVTGRNVTYRPETIDGEVKPGIVPFEHCVGHMPLRVMDERRAIQRRPAEPTNSTAPRDRTDKACTQASGAMPSFLGGALQLAPTVTYWRAGSRMVELSASAGLTWSQRNLRSDSSIL
jgi:uncharacterized protein YbjT (DUF2867 family)